MDYKEYQHARDAAWSLLLRCGIRSLPVHVSSVCQTLGVELRSYQEGEELIVGFGLEAQCSVSDGFAKLYHGRYYIFYRDEMTRQRIRFTVMHEVGHIVLGHLREGGHTRLNREPGPSDSKWEHQANIFASRFLAPSCVLHSLGAQTPEQIAKLCDLSLQSAAFCAQRMEVLEQRGKFYHSPLEQAVFQQFLRFRIREKFCSFL